MHIAVVYKLYIIGLVLWYFRSPVSSEEIVQSTSPVTTSNHALGSEVCIYTAVVVLIILV